MKLSLLFTTLLAAATSVSATPTPEAEPALVARSKINPGQVKGLARTVSQARSSVLSNKNSVDSESSAVLSSWTGKSAQNYKKRLSKFDADAKALASEMASMSDYLQKVARNAEEADN